MYYNTLITLFIISFNVGSLYGAVSSVPSHYKVPIREGVNLDLQVTLPSKPTNKIVLLIAGSGPATKDEVMMGFPVFKVLEEHFLEWGIGVARYDKRGCGKSSGEFLGTTTFDMANDAEKVARYVKNKYLSYRLGIVGHSEGGAIAPMVAFNLGNIIEFLVSMAGPIIKGDKTILHQFEHLARDLDLPNIESKRKNFQNILQSCLAGNDDGCLSLTKIHFSNINKALVGVEGFNESSLSSDLIKGTSQWIKTFVSLETGSFWSKINQQSLILFGEKDTQVDALMSFFALCRISSQVTHVKTQIKY